MKLSIVIPVYGCPNSLKELYNRITKTVMNITKSYEIIMVNDGCPKGSWTKIQELCSKDKKVIGINLSRNFGQQHSTNAGINYSSGDYVVLMDCDLQDRPEAITDLYKKINDGNDIVFVNRKNRKDSFITKFLSRSFYAVYNHFVDGYYNPEIGNYCIVSRKVVDEYKKIKDKNKSFTTTICWMGYKTDYLNVEGDERYDGKSSYTFKKKVSLAINMLTSQSNKPLESLIKVGMTIAVFGFIYLLIQVILYFALKETNEGWTSIIASIFLIGGINLMSLGGVGIYVGNIFNQTKDMPSYIVSEILNERK